ncbi:unnamed protein product [Blepharisma stoltei]|uniref:non-specific serine/threonine protein kinase n=1 Tax=Blepharisma stoltei TaxID=1481888 RepID=A0AAU9KPX2_9CILI|nr:unnamed protein product [Blepharisma stoltei]
MGVCCHKEYSIKRPLASCSATKTTIARALNADTISKHYTLLRTIGYGAFGTVREATLINPGEAPILEPSERHYAIKSINKNKVKKYLKSLDSELSILHMLDHPNICKLYEIYEDQMYIHLVTEYCQGGDLLENWSVHKISTEAELVRIIQKVLLAVNHLHNMHICHRDIKPENILFSSDRPDSEIKLIDFGFSTKFLDKEMDSFVGSPRYMAPEIIKGSYGKECDIWSIGVMTYFLLIGKFPFPGRSLHDQFKNILKGEFCTNSPSWASISPEAQDFISKMLVLNPDNRITATQALNHDWFKSINTKSHTIDKKIFHSIKKYKDKGKLWNIAMKVLVRNLSQDQIDDLKTAFHELDRQRTGFITAEDIQACMEKSNLQLAKEEFNSLLEKIEFIGKGKLNYTQFLIAAADRKKIIDEENTWMTFRYFDIDADGKINMSDLKSAIEKAGCYISETEYRDLLQEFELKFDEDLSYEDFADILNCFTDISSSFCTENDESLRTPIRKLSTRRLTNRRCSMVEAIKRARRSTIDPCISSTQII